MTETTNNTPILDAELFESFGPSTYRQNAHKQVELVWGPETYELPWGTQNFPGPHIRVLFVNGEPVDHYGVALSEFFTTHEPVSNEFKMVFRKTARIQAVLAPMDVSIQTMTEDGNVEAISHVPAGEAYIIKNPGENDFYTNSIDQFESLYSRV